jgi:hypothetical protein
MEWISKYHFQKMDCINVAADIHPRGTSGVENNALKSWAMHLTEGGNNHL